MEKCCLLLSANESYKRASEDIQVLTGIPVSHSTQQRLVHRQNFELPKVEQVVEEISIDGGKVRLRTPKGLPCEWRDYKGVNLHDCAVEAFFQDKELAEKQNTNQAGTIVISHLGKDSERSQKGKYCSNSSGGTLMAFS